MKNWQAYVAIRNMTAAGVGYIWNLYLEHPLLRAQLVNHPLSF